MAALLDNIFKKRQQKKDLAKTTDNKKKTLASKAKSSSKKTQAAKKHVGVKDSKRLTLAYTVLREPHISERAADLADMGKYTFKITLKANKIQVKKAVEDLYGVHVKNVRVIKVAPKKRRLGRTEGYKGGLKRGYKKAIVTLVEGDKIEIMPR